MHQQGQKRTRRDAVKNSSQQQQCRPHQRLSSRGEAPWGNSAHRYLLSRGGVMKMAVLVSAVMVMAMTYGAVRVMSGRYGVGSLGEVRMKDDEGSLARRKEGVGSLARSGGGRGRSSGETRVKSGGEGSSGETAIRDGGGSEVIVKEAEISEYELCDGWWKTFKIVPDESWGSAPWDVQQKWNKMNCNRILGEGTFSLADEPTGGRKRAVVVVWTSLQRWYEYLRPPFIQAARETCATECVWTDDREKLDKADGVLFHPSTHLGKEFPTWDNEKEGEKPKGVQYVFLNLEPVTDDFIKPLLEDKLYMSRFDLTMTYERHSDLPLGCVPSFPASRYFESHKLSFQEKDGFGFPDASVAFVSNCGAKGATARKQYMEKLMEHHTVHSMGKCMHNREEPVLVEGDGISIRQKNKIEVLRRYKFYLAFENNDILEDNVTEKVYNGLQAGTLPVYWGAANIQDYVPRGSIVQARDFASPEALAEHLRHLSSDEAAYEEYFRWRGNSTEADRLQQDVIAHSAYGVNAMCRLCDRLVQDREARGHLRS